MSKNMDVERISLLSDSLLLDILSSLDTKQVVQTCVLSKRWKTLWTLIPTLDFDYDSYPFEESRINDTTSLKERSFKCFISGVLSEHRSEYIKKLSYSFPIFDEKDFVTKFLCYAQCRRAQELYITTFDVDESMWSCLSSCDSLTVLKITCRNLNNLGSLVLPSLTSLVIRREFNCMYYEDISLNEETFSGCPNLESLVLIDCLFERGLISAPKLESLELICALEYIFSLPIVELCTPNLKSVKMRNVIPFVKPASELLCIDKVTLAFDTYDFKRDLYQSQQPNPDENIAQLNRVFGNVVAVMLPPNATQELKKTGWVEMKIDYPDFLHPNNLTSGIINQILSKSTLVSDLSELNMSDEEDDMSNFWPV